MRRRRTTIRGNSASLRLDRATGSPSRRADPPGSGPSSSSGFQGPPKGGHYTRILPASEVTIRGQERFMFIRRLLLHALILSVVIFAPVALDCGPRVTAQ